MSGKDFIGEPALIDRYFGTRDSPSELTSSNEKLTPKMTQTLPLVKPVLLLEKQVILISSIQDLLELQ